MNDFEPLLPGIDGIIVCDECQEPAYHRFWYATYPAIDVYQCRHGHRSRRYRTFEDERRIRELNPWLFDHPTDTSHTD